MGIISYIKEEIQVVRERDPAIKSNMEVLLYPSFKVILHYRIAHKLYLKKHYFLARWISQRGVRKTGIEIHPGATIGKGLFIDHGSGVIIGETAILGDNVTLYQLSLIHILNNKPISLHPLMDFNQSFQMYDILDGANCQTCFDERMNQKQAALQVVERVGLNQICGIEDEWFQYFPEYMEMFKKRLDILKR